MREITATGSGKNLPGELDAYLHDPSNKRCAVRAQGWLINELVDTIVKFRDRHAKRITIEDITIGTVKSISMRQDNTARNLSYMKVVLVKREAVKE